MAVIPSSSMSSALAALDFVDFLLWFAGVSALLECVVVVVVFVLFRAGSSGSVIGVDDRFADAPPAALPLAIDVFREFALSNGDA